MKKSFKFAAVLLLLVSLISFGCSKPQKPSDVVKDFYNYVNAGKSAEAVKLFSTNDVEEAKKSGETLENQLKNLTDNFKSMGFEKVEVTSEKIEGNKATVEVKTYFKGQSQPTEVPLVKEKGAWKLTF